MRLMDGQHNLWSDADACLNDCSADNVIDRLDIVHIAGYVGKAATVVVRGEAAQEEFIRDRLLRILRGDVYGVFSACVAWRRFRSCQKKNAPT